MRTCNVDSCGSRLGLQCFYYQGFSRDVAFVDFHLDRAPRNEGV